LMSLALSDGVSTVTSVSSVSIRDVSEFEFECCGNLTILGKSEIQWIYRLTSNVDLLFVA